MVGRSLATRDKLFLLPPPPPSSPATIETANRGLGQKKIYRNGYKVAQLVCLGSDLQINFES